MAEEQNTPTPYQRRNQRSKGRCGEESKPWRLSVSGNDSPQQRGANCEGHWAHHFMAGDDAVAMGHANKNSGC